MSSTTTARDLPQPGLVLRPSRLPGSGQKSAPCRCCPSHLQALALRGSSLWGQHHCLLLVKVNYLGSFKENVSSQ